AAKKPFTLCDITKAPDSSDDAGFDALRDRVTFEYPSVPESENVETLAVRVPVQFTNAGNETVRIFELIEYECQQPAVIPAFGNVCWNSPQREKAPVIGCHLAL